MKVFLQPRGTHSRAMVRIANALTRYRPPGVTITTNIVAADLVVMYVIGPDALQAGRDLVAQGRQYAAVQCCLRTTGVGIEDWLPFWQAAKLVMSYYDLDAWDGGFIKFSKAASFNFYHAPLGLDDAFIQPFDLSTPREPLCITTGYCDGPRAEAISEVWTACSLVGLRTIHIGPNKVEGMRAVPDNWTAREGVTDEELAGLYRRAKFVSGLRHVEGLELPAAEGASLGATPLVFDQPAMNHWYKNIGLFIPESSGERLVEYLTQVLRYERIPEVRGWLSDDARRRFNWETICTEFWNRIREAQ